MHSPSPPRDPAAAPPRLGLGLRHYVRDYDLILCDLWGVIHDGAALFAEAVEALRRARRAGIVVCLLSNAPRPSAIIARQLRALGFPDDGADAIVTSGECVVNHLRTRFLNAPCCVLGPDRDSELIELGGVRRACEDDAEFILCTGFIDDERDRPEDYRPLFGRLAARGLPMLCANSDRVVMRGDRLYPCAGALADVYRECGGEAIFVGKPYAPIYDLARRVVAPHRGDDVPSEIPSERILCIGDGPATDLRGAADQGMDALFICDGVHRDLGAGDAAGDVAQIYAPFIALCLRERLSPLGYLNRLVW